MKFYSVKAFHMVFWGILLIPIPAFAYLDPGSGSMILQLLLGGVAGVVMVIKLYWHSFLNIFKNKKSAESTLPPSQSK